MHTWFLQAGLGVLFSLPSSNTFGRCLLWHLKKEQTRIMQNHPRTVAYLEVWIIIPEFGIFQIHFPYFVAGTTYCQFTCPYQWTKFFLKCHALLNSSSLLLLKHILSLESDIYKVLRTLNIWKLFWEYLIKNLKKIIFISVLHQEEKNKNHFSNFNPLTLFHKSWSSVKLSSGFCNFSLSYNRLKLVWTQGQVL